MSKITQEQWEKLKPFMEAVNRLHEVKLGDTIDESCLEAIQFFIKDVPKPKLLATVHFDSQGQGYTLNDDIFDMEKSNLKPLVRDDEKQ